MLQCIYFFIIGAFVGWMMECAFKFFTKKFERTPGILNTPFCILYGLGTVVLSLLLTKITNNFWLLFILSFIVLSVMEYVTYILLEKIYGLRLWDYNDMKYNINGKVCLSFSLVWGILGAIYIKYVLPYLIKLYNIIPKTVLIISMNILLGIIIMDFLVSSVILINKKYNLNAKNII